MRCALSLLLLMPGLLALTPAMAHTSPSGREANTASGQAVHGPASGATPVTPAASRTTAEIAATDVLQRLQTAYPDAPFVRKAGGDLYVTLHTSQMLLQPAGVCPQPSPEDPQDPPLCALFAPPYPTGPDGKNPAAGYDPGRVRNQTLLKALYGKNHRAVEANCVVVDFLGQKLLFNQRHGAAAALSRVSARLTQALQKQPEIGAYIFPVDGTFFWRKISKSPRLSAHSFGIAIDLNVKKGLYWQWSQSIPAAQLAAARNSYPQALVDAFEAEGFIWGGKWDAFDLMHFEYRPELFVQP